MAITAFPDGVSSFGMPMVGQGVPIARAYKFVCSTYGSNGNDGTLETPYATIDYAIGKCTASRGDTIVVMPGHTETVTAAAGIALDVAGVNIIGIGEGSIRPTVNFTTAVGASFAVTAANCLVKNILFTGGIDALTGPISIAAADFTLDGCEWRDVTGQATDVILTTAAANRLKIINHRHDGAAAAGGASAIAIVGGDRIRIENCRFDGNFSVGVIDIRTTATTDLEVSNVWARTRNAADIFLVDTITASTGMIGPNIHLFLTDNAANVTEALTGATFVYFQPINIVNLAGESSMQTNITATTDA